MRLMAFKVYGVEHLSILGFILFCFILFFSIRKKPFSVKVERYFRYAMAGTMIALELTFFIWSYRTKGGFNKDLLPFELCSVIMWLTAYALIFNKPSLIKIITPWAIIGSMLAFFFPEVGGDYHLPHFRMFHFFGLHALFLFANLYFFRTKQIKSYTYKDGLKSAVILLIYAAILIPFNYIFSYNYMFLKTLPEAAAFIHKMIKAPFHIFLLVGVIFGLIIAISFLLRKMVMHDEKSMEKVS